ncbi:hypothetical protein [Micromonospora sp. NPDC005206]|uniref:hypothetical protein n=1 Tax=Micromonospora sp. NPDC005206 TaxID=3157022 RepID=UPI00339F3020
MAPVDVTMTVSSVTSTASGVAELLDQPVTHVIADGVRVPHGRTQQPLHRLRIGVTSPFGQRPAGLAFCVRQQPFHKLRRCRTWLRPSEPGSDTRHRFVQNDPPSVKV